MSEFRLTKGYKAHYSSLAELREAWNIKPVNMQTNDLDKLNKQRENFVNRHLCSACKKPMSYISGNIMSCTNPECKGIKHESVNEETGEKRIWYSSSYDLLEDKYAEIAKNIFA